MTENGDKARLYDVIIKNSNTVYAFADSAVIGKTAFIPYDSAHDIRYLITDCRLSDKTIRECEEIGLQIKYS